MGTSICMNVLKYLLVEKGIEPVEAGALLRLGLNLVRSHLHGNLKRWAAELITWTEPRRCLASIVGKS